MPSLNQVHLVGHLGRDAETKSFASGSAVTQFSLALSCGTKDKPKTAWVNVKVWNAAPVVQELQKGAAVMVEGRLEEESWEGKDGKKQSKLVVVAQIVSKPLYEPKGKAANPPAAQQSTWEVTDDDVPF